MSWAVELPLAGPGAEPVDLWRTIISHGLADLPPMSVDRSARALEVTLPLAGRRPRTVRIDAFGSRCARITVAGRRPGTAEAACLLQAVRRLLRLDEDLTAFYQLIRDDPELSWATTGAGRMIRSPTVFEEVVKTICTTNCAWTATERMVGALVEHLGERAPGAPPTGAYGRAFPSPLALAGAGEGFYRDVVRAGYRGRYLIALSESVADASLDLEALGQASRDDLPDDELERRLLALPGVGPYAAAHVMMLLGRYSRLVLDAWTRPTYARLTGGRPAKDATLVRRFRRFGPYAGLAFWLFLTRDWA